jgi:hypothetical protein
MGLRYTVKGTKRAIKRADRYPKVMPLYVMPRAAQWLSQKGTAEAKNIALHFNLPGPLVQTGHMIRNLRPRAWMTHPLKWNAAVSMSQMDKYTRIQEFGSFSPWYPPFAKIYRWGMMKGISSSTGGRPRQFRENPKNDALPFKGSPIYAVWQKLGKRGIKAKRFARNGMKEAMFSFKNNRIVERLFREGVNKLYKK